MSTYHLDGVLISDYMSRDTHAFPRFANELSSAFLHAKADTALLGLIGTCQLASLAHLHSMPYDFLTY
jgi:hypothetical protein